MATLLHLAALPFLLLLTIPPATPSDEPQDAAHHPGRRSWLDHSGPKHKSLLVIMYTSPVPNQERRALVRQHLKFSMELANRKLRQYMNTPELEGFEPITYKFMMGAIGPSADELAALDRENAEHGDIILFNCTDKDDGDPPYPQPSSTTTKVMLAAEWVTQHFNFWYLARMGDDSYYRPDFFLEKVFRNDYPRKLAFIGYQIDYFSFDVCRGKNCPFMSGMGYMMSHDVVRYVAVNRHFLANSFPEDACVGSWFFGTKVQFLHDDVGFHDGLDGWGPAKRDCGDTDIVVTSRGRAAGIPSMSRDS